MSSRDFFDELESSLQWQRYDKDTVETARDVEEFFPDLESAAEYVNAYREAYSGDSSMNSPEDFAERWHESFDGDMSGITEELLYED